MPGFVFQIQLDGHFVGRHGVRHQLFALLVQNARGQKQQRFQQADRMIQLDTVFVDIFRLKDFERTVDRASGQAMQVDALRAEPFGDADFGEPGQLRQCMDAPAFQRFPHPWRNGQALHG